MARSASASGVQASGDSARQAAFAEGAALAAAVFTAGGIDPASAWTDDATMVPATARTAFIAIERNGKAAAGNVAGTPADRTDGARVARDRNGRDGRQGIHFLNSMRRTSSNPASPWSLISTRWPMPAYWSSSDPGSGCHSVRRDSQTRSSSKATLRG